jgi:hypothetical protein
MVATMSVVRPVLMPLIDFDMALEDRFLLEFVAGEELNSMDFLISSATVLAGLCAVLFLVVLTGDGVTAATIVPSLPFDVAAVASGVFTKNLCDRRNIVIGN